MALHGNRRHIKRIAKSRMLAISKKDEVWLKKSAPGAHKKDESIPLMVLLRDILKIAATSKEAKMILQKGDVLIDGKVRKASDYAVGLMDIVSFPKINKHYQIFVVRGMLKPIETPAEDAKTKSCRILNKTLLKGNKVQLNLHDGKNILIEKEEDQFRVGDTIRLTVPNWKIDQYIKLEKGATCYIFKGKHSGDIATLEEIKELPGGFPSDAKLKKGDKELITRKDYLFAVAKGFAF